MRKKLTKILTFLFSLLLLALIQTFILLNSEHFQNYLIEKITQYYSSELNCRIKINHVKFKITHFDLTGIELDDQQNDSLCRIGSLRLYPNPTTLLSRNPKIYRVDLHGARFNFMKHKGIKGNNFDFIRRYFLKGSRKKSGKPPLILDVSTIHLKNCLVSWSDFRKQKDTAQFDLNYQVYDQLNAQLNLFTFQNDSFHFKLQEGSFVEKCGWKMEKFESEVSISERGMVFSNFELTTPYSFIQKNLALRYNDYEDLEELVDSVTLEGEIIDSHVSMHDLKYFNNMLKNLTHDFKISGKISGRISHLKTTGVTIYYGNNTVFRGNARFKGLPEINETYMDISSIGSVTEYTDLKNLLVTENIPSQVAQTGIIQLNGRFNGFFHDFVTDAKFKTEAGDISCNINMKIPVGNEIPSYSGDFILKDFQANKFYQENELGLTDLSAKIVGKGFNLNDLDAKIISEIDRFTFHGYSYKNSKINGRMYRKRFTGNCETQDDNIHLNFDGMIDFQGNQPVFRFISHIGDANLKPLGFDSIHSRLNLDMDIDIIGNDADFLKGRIDISDMIIERKNLYFPLKNIHIKADTRNKNGYMSLNSDIADISLTGNFNFRRILTSTRQLLSHYLPGYFPKKTVSYPQHLTIQAHLKNTSQLSQLLYPDISLGNSHIYWYMNSDSNIINIDADASYFKYKNISFSQIKINTHKNISENQITLGLQTESFVLNDSIHFNNINLGGLIKEDSFIYHAISYEPRQPCNFDLDGHIYFSRDSAALGWKKGLVMLMRKNYRIDPTSQLILSGNTQIFNHFEVDADDESIIIDGISGHGSNHALLFRIENFDISFLNAFIHTVSGGISGNASGNLQVRSILSSPVITAQILMDNFIAGPDTIGNVNLSSRYDDEKNQVYIESRIIGGQMKGTEVKGIVMVSNDNELNIDVTLPRLPATNFSYYYRTLAEQVEGNITGRLHVSGTPKKPVVTGKLSFEYIAFTALYTKIRYSFSQEMTLTEKYVDLGRFYIYDKKGNRGEVSGRLYHNHYENYDMDIYVNNCKNLHCLSTKKNDNDLFYGEAYASGNARFYGTFDDINMDITARSNKGTFISIPVGTEEAAGSVDFINFVSKVKTGKAESKSIKRDVSGIRMNLNFEITPDAEIQLIFDEALGDIMKGTGNANLRMDIDTRGKFLMYGDYTVEKGEYLFTALNVFQKKFYVKPGGTIIWDGDPYKAKMNLFAYYRVPASTSPLLQSAGVSLPSSTGNSKVNVDCNLFLKGELFSPDIKFGLSFPEIENQTSDNNTVLNTILKQIENDPQELNRQIFSLMIMKQFLPRQGTSGISAGNVSTGSLSATVSDMISAQMSNWLSQVAPGWEVNLNYNPGNVDLATKRQVIFQLAKKFGDRVIVEGSLTNSEQAANPWQYNFSGQYILSKDGRMRLKAYSRSNNNVLYNQNVISHGIGFYYRKEFEFIFFDRKKKAGKKN